MSQDTKRNESEKTLSTQDNEKSYFGGIKEFKLEEIEAEILNDNIYLDVFAGSDVRFKDNVMAFEGALNLLANIGVYKYQYKTEEFANKEFPIGSQVGVIAQDLEKILPELVKQDEQGFRFVNYAGLTPVLLSGIQELIKITKQQNETIQNLEDSIERLKKNLASE
jgi:hypothetical protein